MKVIHISIVFIVMLFGVENLFPQYTPKETDSRDPRPEWKQRTDDAQGRHDRQITKIVKESHSTTINGIRRTPETPEQRKDRELENQKTLEEINNLLTAPPEYRTRYAEFLKAKNTGIVRVFPDRGCGKGLVVSVQELERCGDTAQISGGGSLFSFRLNKLPSRISLAMVLHLIGQSDIHFIDGKLVVGTKSIQDIIGDIGEVELADVTLKSDGVQFLKPFKPGDSMAKVALQNQTLASGVNENGYFYSTSAPIKPNRTYVLRSIAFTSGNYGYGTFWNTDVLTVFKAVSQENDGSVVILWKDLKQSKAPQVRN